MFIFIQKMHIYSIHPVFLELNNKDSKSIKQDIATHYIRPLTNPTFKYKHLNEISKNLITF